MRGFPAPRNSTERSCRCLVRGLGVLGLGVQGFGFRGLKVWKFRVELQGIPSASLARSGDHED